MINKEELFPKEKQYSIVIIDLWDDKDSNAFKLLEADEIQQTIEEIRKILNVGDYIMVYNQKGETVEI